MKEFEALEFTWKAVIVMSFVILPVQLMMSAPYGRYLRAGYGFGVNFRLAWVLQECPSFLIPVFVAGYLGGDQITGTLNPNTVLLLMFLLHYFQRSFIYPFIIQGGKPTPFIVFLMAFVFCATNGYVQSRYLLHYYSYSNQWFSDPRFLAGVVLFLLGLAINIQSDATLRGLRKPNETGYKTPKGGLFEYVSCANYFGETVEWWGYALACWSPPGVMFALFTTAVLGTRALSHHKFYLQKIDDYPKDRKAFIPFIC